MKDPLKLSCGKIHCQQGEEPILNKLAKHGKADETNSDYLKQIKRILSHSENQINNRRHSYATQNNNIFIGHNCGLKLI